MNHKIKNIILENEYKLLENFEEYKQSINQYIKKLESIKYDAMLYNLIMRSFGSNEKAVQENKYNMYGFKSSRQLINEYKSYLDLNDMPVLDKLIEGDTLSSLEICSLADNYNNQVGMYYLTGKNAVIIKSTVEDNNRPYDDKWLKGDIILRYCMQSEKPENVNTLNFSHKPNAVIFNSLMDQSLLDIYVFVNSSKGKPYVYKGIYHPCGLVSKNKAFLLFKSGHENEIPLDNLEGQFLNLLINSSNYPEVTTRYQLQTSKKYIVPCQPLKKIPFSKRNHIQQRKIQLEVSLRGEDLVLKYEKNRLLESGYKELADMVRNVSLDNSELGYDILSYDIKSNGEIVEKYIKVSSSASLQNNTFNVTKLELSNIQEIPSKFKFYRVYDIYTDTPKFIDLSYNLSMLNIDIAEYKCSLRG